MGGDYGGNNRVISARIYRAHLQPALGPGLLESGLREFTEFGRSEQHRAAEIKALAAPIEVLRELDRAS
jgi:hypothetical protein